MLRENHDDLRGVSVCVMVGPCRGPGRSAVALARPLAEARCERVDQKTTAALRPIFIWRSTPTLSGLRQAIVPPAANICATSDPTNSFVLGARCLFHVVRKQRTSVSVGVQRSPIWGWAERSRPAAQRVPRRQDDRDVLTLQFVRLRRAPVARSAEFRSSGFYDQAHVDRRHPRGRDPRRCTRR
jgi:hypothetical protein